jgi:hypothetical protein
MRRGKYPALSRDPQKGQKMKNVFSRRARGVRREDPKKNILREMVFYSREFYSFPVNPVGSRSGREKKLCLSWRPRGACLITAIFHRLCKEDF